MTMSIKINCPSMNKTQKAKLKKDIILLELPQDRTTLLIGYKLSCQNFNLNKGSFDIEYQGEKFHYFFQIYDNPMNRDLAWFYHPRYLQISTTHNFADDK